MKRERFWRDYDYVVEEKLNLAHFFFYDEYIATLPANFAVEKTTEDFVLLSAGEERLLITRWFADYTAHGVYVPRRFCAGERDVWVFIKKCPDEVSVFDAIGRVLFRSASDITPAQRRGRLLIRRHVQVVARIDLNDLP